MVKSKNIILITIDSLRADHLSCLGYKKQTTSNIDNLARKGAIFSQMFSNGGGSVTSFPSIMTSTYSLMNPNSNAQNNAFWVKLSDKWTTIAEVLNSKGFSTAAFKNQKVDLSSTCGYNRGFDLFDDPVTFDEKAIAKLQRKISFVQGNKYLRANLVNQKAISWLKNRTEKFFLWLHYMDVHLPYNPKNLSLTNRLRAIRFETKTKNNSEQLSSKDLETLTSFYDEEIKYLDSEIGKFLDELNKIGISIDNTFFVLLSDHGDQHMEHGEWGHGRLYDEVLHVPLIICGPGIEGNTVVEEQNSLLDVPTTIIDLLGIHKAETFLGSTMLPLIEKREKKQNRGFVLSEELGQNFSCRTEGWKYIRYARTNTHELYNLQIDPKEKINLADENPKEVKKYDIIISKHALMEEKAKQAFLEEQNVFLTREQEFLRKYPKKDEVFLSKVLGVPCAQDRWK